MGYTHYWTIKKPLGEAFAEFALNANLIIETASDSGIALAGWNGKGSPTVSDTEISFNGAADFAHETFAITSTKTGFAFCKTAQKPYDSVVCAILIRAKFHFGDAIEISSDGEWFTDWGGGILLYETVFNIQPKSVFQYQ